MNPERLAIVHLPSYGQFRPAAFIVPEAHGIAWVEPSYLDPNPTTQPAVHHVQGDVVAHAPGFDVMDGDTLVAEVRPVGTPGADDDDGSCARALADYADHLVIAGRTPDQEWAIVERLLEGSAG